MERESSYKRVDRGKPPPAAFQLPRERSPCEHNVDIEQESPSTCADCATIYLAAMLFPKSYEEDDHDLG
jgi:hypothetical protein